MKWLLICLFVVILPIPAICNEALVKIAGGGAILQDDTTTNISLISETVIIELDTISYIVDATFEFHNLGDSITVLMGFPKYGYGYSPDFRGVEDFHNFETWVDNKKYDFKGIPGKIYSPWGIDSIIDKGVIDSLKQGKLTIPWKEITWLIKKVKFKNNEKKITRVRYTAPYGRSQEVEYWYGTGRTWNGNIREARFIVKASHHIEIDNIWFGESGGSKIDREYKLTKLNEYEFEYLLKNFEPKEKEVFYIFLK